VRLSSSASRGSAELSLRAWSGVVEAVGVSLLAVLVVSDVPGLHWTYQWIKIKIMMIIIITTIIIMMITIVIVVAVVVITIIIIMINNIAFQLKIS